MRWRVFGCLLALGPAGPLAGQGGLDRTPNLSGDWVVPPGTVQFNFLHRFVRGPGPVRKVSNVPTFLLATSVARGTLVGVSYSTNSTLAASYPNEWEFFLRAQPLTQARGFPVDVGAQVGWNVAADGADGELSLARRAGPFRLLAVGRVLADPDASGAQFAYGGGAALRLTRHLALVGDLATLADRDAARGEKAAWSAGFTVAIPNTPHTLSLHATNTSTGTLQGASRGAARVRYGFEFTIPITLARYFRRAPVPPAPAPVAAGAEPAGEVPSGPVTGALLRTTMTGLRFAEGLLEIARGTTVEWRNDDAVIHTVTADAGGFDSASLASGQAWRFTFTRPGTYAYHCTTHPFMQGKVVVK